MSADIVNQGYITRTELALPNLSLTNAEGYYVQRNGFGPGDVSFRRVYAQSPFVQGQFQVHAVKDLQHTTMKIRVEGVDNDDMWDKIQALTTAVEQFRFTLVFNINGQVFSYTCDTADYAIGDGGEVDDLWLRSDTQLVTLDIPHFPAVAGVL